MQSCIALRIIEIYVQIRMSVKELGYFAFLTKCSIRQQSVLGWFAVMPAALIALIFRCFGHISQDAAPEYCFCESYARLDDPGDPGGGASWGIEGLPGQKA